jgi:hypothetical protein
LAKSALAEAEAAASEVAAMPAGTHEVLDQTREAVESRARILLAQLQELGDDPVNEKEHGYLNCVEPPNSKPAQYDA